MNTDAEFLEEAEDLFERHSFVIETGERVMLQSNLDKLIAAFAFQTAEAGEENGISAVEKDNQVST